MILGAVKSVVRSCFIKYLNNNCDYYSELKFRYAFSSGFRRHIGEITSSVHDGYSCSKKRNARIRAVFLCQVPEAWNSMKPVYLAAKNDPDVDTFLLALPEKLMHENYGVNHEEYGRNTAFDMCRTFDSDTINAYNSVTHQWFDLEKLNPDYVFVIRPYDIHMPPCYKSSELRKYTKICYTPYSYCKMFWDSRFVYNMEFLKNIYVVFTENTYHCNIIRRILSNILHVKAKAEFFGYPRFDLYRNLPDKPFDPCFRKTVLWLPRWTTNKSVEATTFFKYKDILINFFREHKDFRFVCRPHPLMLRNFLSTGEMTQHDVDEFLKIFAEENNFTYDDTPDYQRALTDADIFISDTSSLLVEQFITGKPTIFCGSLRKFDPASRKWANLMYTVRDESELLKQLQLLTDGQDSRKGARQQYIDANMKFELSAGERIIDFLKRDFHDAD